MPKDTASITKKQKKKMTNENTASVAESYSPLVCDNSRRKKINRNPNPK